MRRLKNYMPWAKRTKEKEHARAITFLRRGIQFCVQKNRIAYAIYTRVGEMPYYHCKGLFRNRAKEHHLYVACEPVREYDICIVGCRLHMYVSYRAAIYHLCDNTITYGVHEYCRVYEAMSSTKNTVRCHAAGAWEILYAAKADITSAIKKCCQHIIHTINDKPIVVAAPPQLAYK